MIKKQTSMIFQPLTSQTFEGTLFNDLRLEKRYCSLQQSMIKHKSSVINQVAFNNAESKAYYRFLGNKRVSASELLGEILGDSAGLGSVSGQHLLVAGDTSEISMKDQLPHLKDAELVGLLSDNKTPGFLVHANMAMNAQTGHGLCLSDLMLWTRHKNEEDSPTQKRSYPQKESYKWELGIRNSESLLQQARCITYVFDQESDIFELWENVLSMKPERHFISRAHYDRRVETGEGTTKLFDYLSTIDFEGSYRIEVRKTDRKNSSRRRIQKRKARKATIQLRYAPIKLMPPLGQSSGKHGISLWVVEAIESPDSVPTGEDPIHWCLITSHPVLDIETALQIVRWYEMRWMIEQLFRLLKNKGFRIEDSELGYYQSILKLTVMAFLAAFKVLQLVLARDQYEAQPIIEVFTPEQQKCLWALNDQYQGQTQKQQNPYPVDQLSWASWIIARMGGWKGYQKQRPPGPITMKRGLEKFYTYFEAWELFKERDVYKP